MFIDITRAHPHSKMRRKVWVASPKEDPHGSDPDLCARLLRCVCGLRDAGHNFELFIYSVVESLGFEAGAWSPC
eukprot:521902-Prorocentrum_lima.AAC.1